MTIEFLSHTETKRLAPPVLEMLAPLNPDPHMSRIAVEARGPGSALEREALLRKPFEGGDGAPTALTGRPKYEALLALGLLNDAKLWAARITHQHITQDAYRNGFLDMVKAFFCLPMELEERLLSACFTGATHSGRWSDDGETDSPRPLVQEMIGSLRSSDTLFTFTSEGEYGINWGPVSAAIQSNEYLRRAVNL